MTETRVLGGDSYTGSPSPRSQRASVGHNARRSRNILRSRTCPELGCRARAWTQQPARVWSTGAQDTEQPYTCDSPGTKVVRPTSSLEPGPRAPHLLQQAVCLPQEASGLSQESPSRDHMSDLMLNTPDLGRRTWEAPEEASAV